MPPAQALCSTWLEERAEDKKEQFSMWGKVTLIIRKKLAAVTQGGQRENVCGSQTTH